MRRLPVICLADWLHSVCYGLLALSAESSCRQVNDGNNFHQMKIRPSITPHVFSFFSPSLSLSWLIVKPDCFWSLAGFYIQLHFAPFLSGNLLQILSGITQPDPHPRCGLYHKSCRWLVCELERGGGRFLSPSFVSPSRYSRIISCRLSDN